MNQRARSSAAWLKSFAVWGLSTPSRCLCTASVAGGKVPFACAIADVAKLTRSTTVFEEIRDSLFSQPLTPDGTKHLWHIREPGQASSLETEVTPKERCSVTMERLAS